MTDDRMALIELIEKGADGDLARELLAFAAARLMALAVAARTGAPVGARSPDRLTHRNGYRERSWETRVWKAFLRSLTDRGLRGVRLVVADDHKGLRAAAAKSSAPRTSAAGCIG